ncbi:muscarinic acetylcholine receptor M4-like [Asterias rubens]|uniref:muscarinic acetylcholine receptor M4-like n=1 Tax=Asterias rubens TaxID=7604 RepID=UPI00145590C5|nr:muscarinic acetylcholine receptor M4-like [Asterias rubens]
MATTSDPSVDLITISPNNANDSLLNTSDEFRFDDYRQRVVVGSVYCLVAVTGFVGNVLVILAVILSKKLQTRTNAFVVNLATADLVTCTAAPFTALALLSEDGWPLPDAICSVAAAVYFSCLSCSVMNLTAISINRLIVITKPSSTYRSIYTTKNIAAMLVFTWLYPIIVCCLPLFGLGRWGYSIKYKTCSLDSSCETSKLFSLVGSLLIYPVPLVILFVCYFKIYRHLKGHTKKMIAGVELSDTSVSSSTRKQSRSFSKRQVEITKNLFVVMCAFIVCLAPFAVAIMIPPSDPVIPWTGAFIIFNSAVNPVIYGVKHPHFKEVFRHMLRCRYRMIQEPSGCLQKFRH